MKLAEALVRLGENDGGPGRPKDWYSMEMDIGWAFVSPRRPGMIVVVANNGRVDDVHYTDPGSATAAARALLEKLQG